MREGTTVTVGIDLGDRRAQYCVLDHGTGEVVAEGSVAMRREAMGEWLSSVAPAQVALEAGAQSAWVAQLARDIGHEVVVAQPSKVRLITASSTKSDRADAALLARLVRADPQLLYPVLHRGAEAQAHRALIGARDLLVRTRTSLVNHCRGTVKVFGERLPSCSTDAFAGRVREHIPEQLRQALLPMLVTIRGLSLQIRIYDRKIARLCRETYPETARLSQVPGVGELTALAFVLTLEDPHRFRHSRDVGPYLGLVPRRDQSGAIDKQLRITKAGDRTVRRLLVGCAQYILGPFGPDTRLRRWGMAYAGRGARNAKKRAVVAVARKLSVLLHRLWVTGKAYEPLRGLSQSTA